MSEWHHDSPPRHRVQIPVETLKHVNDVQWLDAPAPPRQHDCWAQTSAYDVFGILIAERCACGALRLSGNPGEHPWLERNSRDDAPELVDTVTWPEARVLYLDLAKSWLAAHPVLRWLIPAVAWVALILVLVLG